MSFNLERTAQRNETVIDTTDVGQPPQLNICTRMLNTIRSRKMISLYFFPISLTLIQCAFKLLSSVGAGSNNSLKMDATHGLTLRFRDDNSSTYAPQLGDRYENIPSGFCIHCSRRSKFCLVYQKDVFVMIMI